MSFPVPRRKGFNVPLPPGSRLISKVMEKNIKWAVVHQDSKMEVSRHDTYAQANAVRENYEALDRDMGEFNEYDIVTVEEEA